jgi:DUF1365 family protein
MNSCLYECDLLHARFSPRAHRFAYRIFLFAIDLDELDRLHCSLRLFSSDKRNLYSFRDGDFLPTDSHRHNATAPGGPATEPRASGASLKDRVIAFLAGHGTDLRGGRILLVTLPRVLGYLFNPVSFYFCYDRTGAPAAAICEVTNTFREVKPYLLDASTHTRGGFRLRVPKHFYVSPYSDVDVAFDFHLRPPGQQLSVQIDDYAGSDRTLTSVLRGTRHALSDRQLAWFTVKYPLLTLRVIALIHWHALRLWLKRVPWFAKAARPAEQRDLYRPHPSLQPSDSA